MRPLITTSRSLSGTAALTALLLAAVGAVAQTKDWDASPLDQVVPVADDETEYAGPEQPAELSDEELLLEEFGLYKQLMQEKVYDEADSVAKRIVELAIRVKGPRSLDTARALSNLGIVQHRTEQYDAAQQNFESAIEIIEDAKDRLDENLLNPLKGLGAAQLEAGRPDLALESFGRAVHITHVNDGPHNADQLEILESLAETNLRLGALDEARQIQDRIYAINIRHHDASALALVPSLMRRAAWQHRAGFIYDERATYRRIIRIIESDAGKRDLRLIDPLTKLGHSFFFVDMSGSATGQQSITTGEIYFRRALRIAEENPDSDWETLSTTRIALGDYYMLEGNHSRASKIYRSAWELLSEDETRFEFRERNLEQPIMLRRNPLPEYAGEADSRSTVDREETMHRGKVTVTYSISSRGRVSELKIVEAEPPEFEEMQLAVQRELRRRIYRPRFEAAEPVESPAQLLTHRFYYRQADLDARRAPEGDEQAAADERG